MGFLISTLVGGVMDANKLIKQNKAQNDDSFQNVVVNGKYSIDVPSFLSPLNSVNEDASLQYGSRTLDISFQVIDESKTEFLSASSDIVNLAPSLFGDNDSILFKMATVVLSNFFDIDKVKIGNYSEITINGLNAVTLNVFQKRTFLKDALYGNFAFIEGKDTLYQVIILSGGTSITKLAEKLEKSIKTFKEL